MTVTTTNNRNTYTTNGVTTTFPITFKFRSSADLLVIFVSSAGVVSFPPLNIDFVVNIFIDFTGELVFTPAPANAGTLHIIRRRTFVQSTSAIGKEEFSASEIETIADNLMFFIQDLADLQARSMVIQDYAVDGVGQFDARSNRIMNLEDPVNLQDAVTKSYALANLMGAPGTNGTNGSVWRSGSGVPGAGLGVITDWYLNDSNGDIYEKTGAAVWTLRDNLTGPQGLQGIPGINGMQGEPTYVLRTIAGTAQAATALTGKTLTQINQYSMYRYLPNLNNTGADPQINIDILGLLTIKGPIGQTLAADELDAGVWVTLMGWGATPATSLRIVQGF